MGNCVATSKVVSETDDKQRLQPSLSTSTKKVSVAMKDGEEKEEGRVKRKMVAFKPSDDQRKVEKRGEEGSGNGGRVRIRVVVTKEELRQIVKHRKDLKFNSLEELVSRLRLRERRVNEGCSRSDYNGGSWRPALETIPEDHFH